MIKAIVFDFGGVVLSNDWDPENKNFVNDFKKNFGISPEDMKRAWGLAWPDFMKGKISEDKFWLVYLKTAGGKIDVEKAKEIYRKHQSADKSTIKIIEKLKSRYRIVALTNISKEWLEYKKKKFDLDRYFEFIVSSCYEESSKSGEEIYKKTLERLTLPAEECLFIDDRERNILIAKKLGFKTILFRGAKELERKLKELGINYS